MEATGTEADQTRNCAVCGTDISSMRRDARVCRNRPCRDKANKTFPRKWVRVADKRCTVIEDGVQCPNEGVKVTDDGRWCQTHLQRFNRYGSVERQWNNRLKPGEPLAIVQYAATLDDDSDCYLRLGSDGNRWTVNYAGRMMTAARAVWMARHNDDPGELHVLHTCHRGHEGCITGGHLRLGNHQENVMEMVPLDRASGAKLTNEQATQAKARYRGGEVVDDLAAEYGVYRGTMWRLVTGRTWKHLD
jgi:hypothetical protein